MAAMDSVNCDVSVSLRLLVDKKGLAGAFSVSVRELERMISRGEVPAPIHLGRRVVWRLRTIEALVEKWERTGGPKPEGVETVLDRGMGN